MTWREIVDEAFRRSLSEASRTLEEIGEDPALSTAGLERYARACADAALIRFRWESKGAPTSCVGGNGQWTVHPLFRGIAEAEREASRLAETLGLTPTARKTLARRVGHPKGAGQAPDRRSSIRRVA